MVTITEGIERRCFTSELRAETAGSIRKLTGYAAVFGALSEDLGGFRERIAPGAFRDSLGNDIRALWNHNTDTVLGRTKSGTLVVEEDSRGLRVVILPPDTEQVRGLLESVKRGDVDQMSFGFRVETDGESWSEEGGVAIRTLTKVRLYEVSPVTFPAYEDTEVVARSRPTGPVNTISAARLRLRLLDLAARSAGIDF